MASISIPMLRDASHFVFIIALFSNTLAYADTCAKPVYMTFDVGNMSAAESIAKTLKQKNVRATFFLANNPTKAGNGALSESWKNYWVERVKEGHSFGNHTWSHFFQRKDKPDHSIQAYTAKGESVVLNIKAFCEELKKVETAFDKLTGHNIHNIWRAPAGRTTQLSIRWAASCGYPVHVGWSQAGYLGDDLPSDKHPNEKILIQAAKNIQSGDIVLMHLGVWSRKQQAADILPELIDNLRSRDLCFKTLGEKNY